MNINILTERRTDKPIYIHRYIKFILSRSGIKQFGYHHHHILPKAKDFYPEFKNLKVHPENGIYLSPREHYIAHKMLALAFPKSTQAIAFYNMSNIQNLHIDSKIYAQCRKHHIEKLKIATQCPIRNAKISKALKGIPKSAAHIANLIGHEVTLATREKLRKANLGHVRSKESIAKQKETFKKNSGKHNYAQTEECKLKISQAHLKQKRKWYNDTSKNKQFKITDVIPDGWSLGRLPWM